jgi:hypothetical protein
VWTCDSDPLSGLCAKPSAPPWFLYRRSLDPNFPAVQSMPGDYIRAEVNTGGLVQFTDQPITITAPSAHITGTVLQCTSDQGPPSAYDAFVQQLVRPLPMISIPVRSDTNFAHAGVLNVTCTPGVMDLEANTLFDYPAYYPPGGPPPGCQAPAPTVHFCHTDDVATYAPLGTVTFSITNTADGSTTGTPFPLLTCQLGSGAGEPPPAYLPRQPQGQVRYYSWCPPVTIAVPAGKHWTVIARYNLPTSGHNPNPSGPVEFGGFPAPVMHIDT